MPTCLLGVLNDSGLAPNEICDACAMCARGDTNATNQTPRFRSHIIKYSYSAINLFAIPTPELSLALYHSTGSTMTTTYSQMEYSNCSNHELHYYSSDSTTTKPGREGELDYDPPSQHFTYTTQMVHEESHIQSSYSRQTVLDTPEVLRRIEAVVHAILLDLEQEAKLPRLEEFHEDIGNENVGSSSQLSDKEDSGDEFIALRRRHQTNRTVQKEFNLQQSRSMTSIVMVLSYCHNLLLKGKTTTLREVYYFYVTHFRNQKECDLAVRDTALLLNVPRHALGLKASPKGWYCGDLQITTTVPNGESFVTDARALTSLHGAPIDSTWVQLCNEDANDGSDHKARTIVSTVAAQCILVVEKGRNLQSLGRRSVL